MSVWNSVWYELCVLFAEAAAAGVGSGAAPVDCSEAPTEDNPPLGSEFVVSELDVPDEAADEPIEDMPLIGVRIPPAGTVQPGKQACLTDL